MNQFDIHICGMHERDEMIAQLVKKLELSYENVHYDDRSLEEYPIPRSKIYTSRKAYLAEIPEGLTHRVVFDDDMDVCNNFKEICQQIIDTHPNDFISLFPADFIDKIPSIENLDTPYLETEVLCGNAVIIPVQYLQPCFDYIKEEFDDECDDEVALVSFAQENNIKIITTIPSTVQPVSFYSLLRDCEFEYRTVYYNSNPTNVNWQDKRIVKYQLREQFSENIEEMNKVDAIIQISQ